mmetsp:Transcript_59540/g.191599  ORF Transcript_59540/g.191599 Transcript_59540/m.191599 type:complete len:236 (-) Transcript_59540:494-1201(-)
MFARRSAGMEPFAKARVLSSSGPGLLKASMTACCTRMSGSAKKGVSIRRCRTTSVCSSQCSARASRRSRTSRITSRRRSAFGDSSVRASSEMRAPVCSVSAVFRARLWKSRAVASIRRTTSMALLRSTRLFDHIAMMLTAPSLARSSAPWLISTFTTSPWLLPVAYVSGRTPCVSISLGFAFSSKAFCTMTASPRLASVKMACSASMALTVKFRAATPFLPSLRTKCFTASMILS